ncbi:hypothetical protein GOV13_04755 [Candidatus Pacearchaeota archaeon]|nr:hypothetical protein [Candidatus Pacearchaeota archaeon]
MFSLRDEIMNKEIPDYEILLSKSSKDIAGILDYEDLSSRARKLINLYVSEQHPWFKFEVNYSREKPDPEEGETREEKRRRIKQLEKDLERLSTKKIASILKSEDLSPQEEGEINDYLSKVHPAIGIEVGDYRRGFCDYPQDERVFYISSDEEEEYIDNMSTAWWAGVGEEEVPF